MKRTLIRLGLTALISSALFGCGGGSDGVDGAATVVQIKPSTPASTISSNATTPTSASVAAWRALEPKITVTSVTINSPPVVNFAVTDANGAAVVGLKNYTTDTRSTRVSLPGLSNMSFTLAKLIPATASAPSKWVSYLVTNPPTNDQAGGKFVATDSCTPDKKWCGTYPTTDKEGDLVDNGDGTYKYTFKRDIKLAASIVGSLDNSTDGLKLKADLGDVSFDAGATHRLGIAISGAAPGTGTNVPSTNGVAATTGVNIAIPGNYVYDFVPNGGAVTATRSIVDIDSCSSCHNGKGLAHGFGRKDPNLCVTCHTDQVKYGMSGEATRSGTTLSGTTSNTTSVIEGRAIGNFPNFVHKAHMGSELKLKGYNYFGKKFDEVEWIQDPRDCTKCHSGAVNPLLSSADQKNVAKITKDGDNWKNKPNQLACGACHDNISFAAVVPAGLIAHTGGVVTDGDASCASCHAAAGPAGGVDVAHRTEVSTANNPVPIADVASISYEIKSVVVNASKVPEITFRIMNGSDPVMSFNTPTLTATSGVYSVPASFELFPGFTQAIDPDSGRTYGPTFYVAYALPQDGIPAPADFNVSHNVSLANVLVASGHPKAGTLTGPTADGYWTVTMTGSSGQLAGVNSCTQSATAAAGYCASPTLIKIPTAAKMVTGAIIGNLAQTKFPTGSKAAAKYSLANYPKGLIIKTPLKQLVADKYTARRTIVDNNKCESCHEQLGTAVSFHAGARNDGTSCAICHTTNTTSGGWSANASTFIHGIHAGTDSTIASAITKSTGANSIANVGNPGSGRGGAGTAYSTGKRYVPFSYHRDNTGFNAAAVVYPGILKRCESCHVSNAVNFGATGATLLPNLLWTTSAASTYSPTDTYKVYARDPVTGAIKYISTSANYGNVFGFTPEGSAVAKYTNSSNAIVTSGFTDAADTPVTAAYLAIAGAQGVKVAPDPATLVESPVTAACFACHDSNVGKAHMTQYGGVIYGVRSTSTVSGKLVNNETCLICHGMGRANDAAVVHAK